jgi:hypothetical protein
VGELCASRGAERGQALPLFVIVFVAMIGFVGLAIDGARLYSEHARLQGAADAAALGAAHELRRGNDDYSANLLPAAIHDAGLQGVTPSGAEIIVHHPPVSGAFADSPDHVEVVVRTQLATTFMAMFGVGRRPVSSRAVAGLAADDSACVIALADDADALTVEGEQPFEPVCAIKTAVADPYAGLRTPACAGRSPAATEAAPDGGEQVYWPGCYDAPAEIAEGRVQLMPGVHVFQRGLRITGGEVTGRDVVLAFPSSEGQTGVEIRPEASVTLSAPNHGELPGILLFGQASGAPWTAGIERGAGSDLQGGLYFPGRTLRWAPNAPGSLSWVQAVAARIVVLEAPGGRAVQPPPAGEAAAFVATLVE